MGETRTSGRGGGRGSTVAILALPMAFWLVTALATGQQGTPAARFFDVVQVEIVNLEVIVTDRDGSWVGDLTRDDFAVLEDGKPVGLSNFLVVEEGRVVSEVEVVEGAEPPPAPVRPPVNLVIYVDNANLRPGSRNRVLRQVRQLVGERMMGGDRVMVVSFDRRLKVHLPFSDDPERVLEVLEEVATASGAAVGTDADRRLIMRRLERPMGEAIMDARATLQDIESFAASLHQDSKRAIATLQGFTASLAGLPGRKALLFVSDGLASRPAEDLFNAWFAVYGAFSVQLGVTHPTFEAGKNSVSPELLELVAHANASGVTFFSVSAEGLDSGSEMLPEVMGLAPNGTRTFDPILNFADTLNRVDMLQHIADATGGRAILKASVTTLEEVAEDLERYYFLGYLAPNPGDRKVHKIEVKVSRPGLKLRYRDSHRGKPVEERAVDTAYGALWGVVDENPFHVALDIANQADKDKRSLVLSILVTFSSEKLALLPRDGFRQGSLRLFFAVQDEKGDLSGVTEVPVPLKIPEAGFAATPFPRLGYGTKLRMRAGRQSVALCVLDELTQQTSVIRATINLGKSGRVVLDDQPLLNGYR